MLGSEINITKKYEYILISYLGLMYLRVICNSLLIITAFLSKKTFGKKVYQKFKQFQTKVFSLKTFVLCTPNFR